MVVGFVDGERFYILYRYGRYVELWRLLVKLGQVHSL